MNVRELNYVLQGLSKDEIYKLKVIVNFLFSKFTRFSKLIFATLKNIAFPPVAKETDFEKSDLRSNLPYEKAIHEK